MRPFLPLTVAMMAAPVWAQSNIAVSVDASLDRHAIDPRIYGVAMASNSQLAALNAPLNRWGGNNTTRYNWEQNSDNRAHDWYFQSIAYDSATPGAEADSFISNTRNAGSQPMMTIPLIDWVAKLGPGRSKLASFSIAKYGEQQDRDWQWMPDAGNGIRPDGSYINNNDPNDASTPNSVTMQANWINHLVTKWGASNAGGLRYYIMDNEPSIWHASHRDVQKQGLSMGTLRDKTIAYATKVKDRDPNALVVAPEEWGWTGYFYSGQDQQWGAENGWDPSRFPDRGAHGGANYLDWLAAEFGRAASTRKLVDIFTVHYYPQGGEFWGGTDQATQLLRNRSTRSLWDPTYRDESWIGDYVKLIPRLKGWASTAGALSGITEYNWGAEGHINGATAQADIYGIFGREGLDIANRWTTPAADTPTFKAMQLYRNYDGKKGSFGETSVRCRVPNPDVLSAFASVRAADNKLTVMVVHKALSGTANLDLSIANFANATGAQVWQLTSSNAITRKADLTLTSNRLVTTLPAQSITLFVIGNAGPPPADTTAPIATVTTPANNATVENLTQATGTAADAGGLKIVTALLYRYAGTGVTAGYWAGGNTWNETYNKTTHERTVTGLANWTLALPTLAPGRYSIRVRAEDNAGNAGRSNTNVFTVQNAPPTVSITRPAPDGTTYTSVTSATGTASDAGGVASVAIWLYRAAQGSTPEGYWAGGNTWTTTYNAAVNLRPCTGTNNWSITLPSLPNGSYRIRARAVDSAGNAAMSDSNRFIIQASRSTG